MIGEFGALIGERKDRNWDFVIKHPNSLPRREVCQFIDRRRVSGVKWIISWR